MIKRYSVKEIETIWSDQNKFDTWLEIEKQLIVYLYSIKKIDENTYLNLVNNMSFDLEKIYELEETTKHDVIAFLRAISLNIEDKNLKKWIHYGLTSTDVVDTANAVLIKQTNDIILSSLKNLYKELKKTAYKYKSVVQIGRTHGIHGEPTSFGYKFAIWCDEMNRNFERFNLARKNIETGKISGAVGTFANTGIKMQDFICKKLKINSSNCSTQVLQRDNHAFYFSVLATIASTLEKIALELRHLARTEVNEINEAFSFGQKGSSAMPHKKNPIGLENICGLTRMIKAYASVPFENNSLWHERDISHSSNERILFLDATTLLVYTTNMLTNIIKNLVVNKDVIKLNLNLTNGLIFSQSVLLSILENKCLSREYVYDEVQKIALECYKNKKSFLQELKNSDLYQYIDKEKIDEIFDLKRHLKYMDDIYKRIFG